MQRLQAEMDEAMPDRKVLLDGAGLNRLPYLNAFIKEGTSALTIESLTLIILDTAGLRIYGAAPSLLERVVPSRLPSVISKSDGDFDMMGYALPPGTIVSTQAWSMHRDAEVFPSPETFLPERWLSVDGSKAEEDRLMR